MAIRNSIKRNKVMQKSGAITIPSDVRKRLGYKKGGAVSLEETADGAIVIRPLQSFCAICQTDQALARFNNVPVCFSCAKSIGKMYDHVAPTEAK